MLFCDHIIFWNEHFRLPVNDLPTDLKTKDWWRRSLRSRSQREKRKRKLERIHKEFAQGNYAE